MLSPMTAEPMHIHGTFLPDEEPRDFWVADGRLTAEPVAGARTLARDAYIIPGLVDAHCHIGLGVMGAVSVEETRRQARADLAAGTMLIRDAGSARPGTAPAPAATSATWPLRWNLRP